MKLKCSPDDFIVTEISSREPTSGSYALYRVQKRSIGTLEALQLIQRSWNLSPKSLSHAGMKDRHAATSQLVTIRNGPKSDFTHDLLSAEYLGQTETAMTADDIVGNQFQIVVRSLSVLEADAVSSRACDLKQNGYPNYFDQQRFGSLGPSSEFVGARWCQKNYERAVWLALAEYNRHDDGAERQQKETLRAIWGQWPECKRQLGRSHRRSVVTYLCDHPTNFRKAFALINVDLRGLYLSAFQSAVWNRMLASTIGQAGEEAANGHTMFIGDTQLPIRVAPGTPHDLQLPLPSARCKQLDDKTRQLCDAALRPYGMTLPGMKVSFPRDRWFSRALRRCLIVPQNLEATTAADDVYQGRYKAELAFQLPPGSYATMLIKVLTAQAETQETDSDDSTTEQEPLR